MKSASPVSIVSFASLALFAAPLLVACSAGTSDAAGGGDQDPSVASPLDGDTACVEPGRYTVVDDIVTDAKNDGRRWQRRVDPTLRSEADAEVYCASLVIDDVSGWRLPTAHEIQSLLLRPIGIADYPGDCEPPIDQRAFTNTPEDIFWTTSKPTGSLNAGSGYYTGFDDGRTHLASLDTPMYARCVHDPASAESPTFRAR